MALGPGPMEILVQSGQGWPGATRVDASAGSGVYPHPAGADWGERTRRDWATDAECIIKLWPCPIYPKRRQCHDEGCHSLARPERGVRGRLGVHDIDEQRNQRQSCNGELEHVAMAVGTRRTRLVTVGVNPLCHEGRGCTPKRRQEPERHLPPHRRKQHIDHARQRHLRRLERGRQGADGEHLVAAVSPVGWRSGA